MSRTARLTGIVLLCLIAAVIFVGWRLYAMTTRKTAVQPIALELIEALDQNDLARAKRLMARGPDAGAREEYTGRTALMAAARSGDPEILSALVKRGADVDALDNSGTCALAVLLSSGHANPELAQMLMPNGQILHRGVVSGSGLVALAVQSRNAQVVAKILESGGNPNETDLQGRPVIIDAVEADDPAMLQAFLRHHARVNASGGAGERALPTAIKLGNGKAAKALIDAGADLEHRDQSGDPPLVAAAEEDQPEIVAALLAKGARVDSKNKSGQTALIVAAREGRTPIVDQLLRAHADPGNRDSSHRTALAWATEQGFEDIRRTLSRHSAGGAH